MLDLLFSLGHMLSVLLIAAGLAILIWHDWVLASKLGNHRTAKVAVSSPLQSHGSGNESPSTPTLIRSSGRHSPWLAMGEVTEVSGLEIARSADAFLIEGDGHKKQSGRRMRFWLA